MYPAAYVTFLSYSFLTPLSHLFIVLLFFVCRSVLSIDWRTLASGVVFAGLTSESAWMMCQPYCVWTGGDVWPVLSENATLSNCGTVSPLVIVSLPPTLAELGSFEYCFASFAKSAPFLSCVSSWSASDLLFTRMWRTLRDEGVVYDDLCDV